MAEDILSQLLGGNKSTESQYYDILNRRTAMDDIGDAFTSQSTQPAINAKQKMSNALMAGVGAGFKASQTSIRDRKMQEVEASLKQVVDQNMELQRQLGKTQLTKAIFANYVTSNYGDFKKWNDAEGAGDQKECNKLGMLLFNRFAEENPELVKNSGKIDHIYNGKAYFDKDGKIGGIYLKDLLEPLITTLPEEQQKELINLTSLTNASKFTKSDLMDELTLKEKSAKITSEYAAANQANAHADYYRGETDKPKDSKINEFEYKQTRKINDKFLEKLNDNIINQQPDIKIKVLDKLKDILEKESSFGGTPLNAVERFYKKVTGDDINIQEARYLQKYFFKDIKGVAGNPNQKEWADLITRIISGEQNVEASLNMIEFEKEQALEMISNYEEHSKILADTDYKIPHNHPEITNKLKKIKDIKNNEIGFKKENNKNIDTIKNELEWGK